MEAQCNLTATLVGLWFFFFLVRNLLDVQMAPSVVQRALGPSACFEGEKAAPRPNQQVSLGLGYHTVSIWVNTKNTIGPEWGTPALGPSACFWGEKTAPQGSGVTAQSQNHTRAKVLQPNRKITPGPRSCINLVDSELHQIRCWQTSQHLTIIQRQL